MNKSNKLNFISYLYGFGALFVVLGHSTPTSYSDAPEIINTFRDFIYMFHMPLFFFIAGFLFKYSSDLNCKKYSTFIKDKCIRFLTPYVVLSLVGIIPKLLISGFVNDNVEFSFIYIVRTLFCPRDSVWGHFWFLPTILIIYTFSYLILKAYKNKAVFITLLLISLLLAIFPIQINWLAINDICKLLIYFCIGILVKEAVLNNKNTLLRIDISIYGICISVILFVILKFFGISYNHWIYNLSNIIIAILINYALMSFSVLIEKKGSKMLDYLDGKTFSIYIISWPCQAVTEIIFNRVLHMHWYIVIPAMFIAGLGIPLLVNAVYKRIKWHPKFINLVFGFSVM